MARDARARAAGTDKSRSRTPRIPRITTRGSYDLTDGSPLYPRVSYRLYPRRYFEDHARGAPEMIIVVHGLRNDDRGAAQKVVIARDMLRRLGRRRHARSVTVGFSYDSNTRGAHTRLHRHRSHMAGRRIAESNGRHLAEFLMDFKRDPRNRATKVRLLGHSLGSEVIYHAITRLAGPTPSPRRRAARGIIESVHLFGSSLPSNVQDDARARGAINRVVRGRLVNYYAPTDDVLADADSDVLVAESGPLGLRGVPRGARRASRYAQHRVRPANHRFASYADTLRSFP